ncbi:MAG: hypothetical protein ACRDP4_15015, partial [Nocardioidaceae bacterium]
FSVPESPPDDGRLSPDAVGPIRTWLDGLAADPEARAAVVRQTLGGALRSLGRSVRRLSAFLADQQQTTDQLRDEVEQAYSAGREAVAQAIGGAAQWPETEAGLQTLIIEEAAAAADRAAHAWQSSPAGAWLLEQAPTDIAHGSPDLKNQVARAVRDGHGDLASAAEAVFVAEQRRFLDLLEPHAVPAKVHRQLLELSRDLDDARWPEATA